MNDDPKRKPAALTFHRHRDGGNNPSPRWIIKGLIPETGTGLLSGQNSTFKSFVMLDMGAAITSAETFLGRKSRSDGAVLIFASEGWLNIGTRIDAVSAAKHGDTPLPIYTCADTISLLVPRASPP